MPPAGFEPAVPASERPPTHAVDRAVAGIGGLRAEKLTEAKPFKKFSICCRTVKFVRPTYIITLLHVSTLVSHLQA